MAITATINTGNTAHQFNFSSCGRASQSMNSTMPTFRHKPRANSVSADAAEAKNRPAARNTMEIPNNA